MTCFISICIYILLGLSQATHPSTRAAGISQFVENRAGRLSCWGVVIQLREMRLKKTIRPDQIEIRDGKHGQDLRKMMLWSVENNHKRLVIKFKRGMGDFGTGNTVQVKIDRSAFVAPIQSTNNHFLWALDTDVM